MATRGGLSTSGTFTLATILIILLFAGLIGYLGYNQISREKGHVERDALSRARTLAAQVEPLLTARIDGVVAAAKAVAGGANPATQARQLNKKFPDLAQVRVVNSLGALIGSTAPAKPGRRPVFGDQRWFKRAATSIEPFVGEPREVDTDIMVGLYAPARTPEGQFRGVVAADLTLKRVQDLLIRARLPEGTVAELLTDGGRVVARRPPLFLMQDVRGLAGYTRVLGEPEHMGELVFEDRERRLMGSVAIRPAGWVVAVGLPSAQVLTEARNLLVQVAGGAAVVSLFAFFLARMIAGRATRGMDRLRAAMSRLEAGDIPANVPLGVGGEVGALTASFNRMLDWLRGRFREYEALRQIEEAAGTAITVDRSASEPLAGLLRRVVHGMGADAGVIVIEEEDGLVTRAAVGFPGHSAEGVTLRRGQGLAGAVIGGREAIAVPDVESDYRVEEPYFRSADIRSVMGVPITSGDRALGAIEVAYRSPHTSTGAELQRLEAMARRAAQALEHARSLEQVRRNTSGLEAQLAEHMSALQKAATDQAEARRQAQEARRQAQELEQTIRMQVSQAQPAETARVDPAAEEVQRVRVALQKTVSEELRVPLSALLDLPRFLVDGVDKALSETERQQLEVLHSRGEEILELIDNLAILSGLHAGQVKVARAPVNLPELLNRIARALQPRAAAKGNRIEADIKPGVGQVISDSKRLEQILTNLLLNAIKYTEVGEIRLTCHVRETNVVITVADDGVGFTPEEQERMFEPFLQIGPRDGRTVPGTGLSLSVCQQLVRVLGGSVRIESEVDRGSWFTVSLPIQS